MFHWARHPPFISPWSLTRLSWWHYLTRLMLARSTDKEMSSLGCLPILFITLYGLPPSLVRYYCYLVIVIYFIMNMEKLVTNKLIFFFASNVHLTDGWFVLEEYVNWLNSRSVYYDLTGLKRNFDYALILISYKMFVLQALTFILCHKIWQVVYVYYLVFGIWYLIW